MGLANVFSLCTISSFNSGCFNVWCVCLLTTFGGSQTISGHVVSCDLSGFVRSRDPTLGVDCQPGITSSRWSCKEIECCGAVRWMAPPVIYLLRKVLSAPYVRCGHAVIPQASCILRYKAQHACMHEATPQLCSYNQRRYKMLVYIVQDYGLIVVYLIVHLRPAFKQLALPSGLNAGLLCTIHRSLTIT